MRKFLLILACAFSFCVHAETNTVQLTQDQYYRLLDTINDYWNRVFHEYILEIGNNGYVFQADDYLAASEEYYQITKNIAGISDLLHLIMTGNSTQSYDTSSNNILAYASSLSSHNSDVRELLDNIESNTHVIDVDLGRFFPYVTGIYDTLDVFHNDYTNNFERLYDAITNLDFNVSISNQIDLLQVMNGTVSNNLDSISNVLDSIYRFMQDWAGNQQADFGRVIDHMHRDHDELMDFLHSLSNSALFASNLCDCCNNPMVSNYQDSVISMMMWMTNKWPNIDQAEPPEMGGNNSNRVWAIWRPQEVAPSGWFHLYVPTVEWVEDIENNGNFRARYGDSQYDSVYNAVWEQYQRLLQDYRANGIDGQQFFAGLVDLQLHIMANMSTQLYMIDQKMPSKTNLWNWIEEYKQKVSDEVKTAEEENSEIVDTVSSLIDYTPFSMVGGHFPKVSASLNSLRVEEGASPVVRIPIPRVLRKSDSDELVVDVRDSDWYSSGRNWCRWVFTFIWGWLFIRFGIVPIFYVVFFTVRVAEIAAHLVFMGSIRGSSGIVSSFGAAAVDMVLSLIGIDTDFKKFVWGIMRN